MRLIVSILFILFFTVSHSYSSTFAFEIDGERKFIGDNWTLITQSGGRSIMVLRGVEISGGYKTFDKKSAFPGTTLQFNCMGQRAWITANFPRSDIQFIKPGENILVMTDTNITPPVVRKGVASKTLVDDDGSFSIGVWRYDGRASALKILENAEELLVKVSSLDLTFRAARFKLDNIKAALSAFDKSCPVNLMHNEEASD